MKFFSFLIMLVLTPLALVADYSATNVIIDPFFRPYFINGYYDSLLIVQGKYLYSNNEPIVFLKSINQGKTWDSLIQINKHFSSVSVFSNVKIYNTTHFIIAASATDTSGLIKYSYLLATKDGGLNCNKIMINDSIIFKSGIEKIDNGFEVIQSNQGLLVSEDSWESYHIINYPDTINEKFLFIPSNGYTKSVEKIDNNPILYNIFEYSQKNNKFTSGKIVLNINYPHPFIYMILKSVNELILHISYKNFDINGKETQTIKSLRSSNQGVDWFDITPIDSVFRYGFASIALKGDTMICINGKNILSSIDGGLTWRNNIILIDFPINTVFSYYISENLIYFTTLYGLFKLDFTTDIKIDVDNSYLLKVIGSYIKVSPIPAKNIIIIDLTYLKSIVRNLRLLDLNGFCLFNKELLENDSSVPFEINVSHYSSGIKFIAIQTLYGVIYKKILIE